MSEPSAGLAGNTLVAGRYRVHEQLGAGGMGVVFRATDTRLKREVAIKRVLLRGFDDDEAADVRRRTLREAEIAARVHHPRIVAIFDVLDDAGGPLLVLEYLPSRSLDAVVRDVGVLTPGVAARVAAQVAEALAAAHAAGIVHRDVKPGNVLVGDGGPAGDPVGPVKLADFGISQIAGSGSMTATAIGTPAYFAPEIARGDAPDAASDVYALGAMLCTVVQGAPPFGFPGGNPLELIRRIGHDPVPPPTVGGPLGELITSMIAAAPADRPRATEARTALWQLADRPQPVVPHPPFQGPSAPAADEPVGPAPGGSEATPPGTGGVEATVEPPPRRPWYARPTGLVAVVLLAVAVGGGVLVGVRTAGDGSDPSLPAALPTLTIGDPRTADPCALVDPEALRRYGTPTPVPDYGTFANCAIDVETGPDASFEVSTTFGPASGTPPEGEQQRLGDALIVREPADEQGCNRHVVLADGTPIDIAVDHGGPGEPPVDVCAVADTAVASAATTLADSGIGRRAIPPGPLWSTDACSLLTPDDLAFLPPDRRRVSVRGFADWQCQWSEGTEDGWRVSILFDRLDTPAETGRPVPGTPVFLDDDDPAGRCNAEVPNRPYLGSEGRPLAEEIRMRVEGSKPRQELCDQAIRLAILAAGRL